MDIRLSVNTAMRAELLMNQIKASASKAPENDQALFRSQDTFALSGEAAAAYSGKASPTAASGTKTEYASFAEQWRAERQNGIVWKPGGNIENGKIDDSETTFFSYMKGTDAYTDYLRSIGRPITPKTPCWSTDYDIGACQFIRTQIAQSVQELLRKNGITIPQGQSFTMTVDAGHYIHVTGLDDPELKDAVERAINVGNNGYYLHEHLAYCSDTAKELGLYVPSSKDVFSEEKASLLNMAWDLSGYDIRELEQRDGYIYTPDGQDLWKVLWAKSQEAGVDITQYWGLYSRVAQLGWTGVPEWFYSLRYMDGNLYDVGAAFGYGPGQTGWQDWARANAEDLNYIGYPKQANAEKAAKYMPSTEPGGEWDAPAAAGERPDPSDWPGPWMLTPLGDRIPMVTPDKELRLEDGKQLEPDEEKSKT